MQKFTILFSYKIRILRELDNADRAMKQKLDF